jgi:membrane associated rhomboid family serine protease
MIDLIEIARCASLADAEQRSLVLAAVGIDCRISGSADGYSILVNLRSADRARRELSAYARENAQSIRRSATVPAYLQGVNAVLGACAVLLFLAAASRRHAWLIDWTAAGAVEAGKVVHGEWWRTVTALGLHADASHLLSNLAFGIVIALLATQLLGSGVGWLAMLLAGALGNGLNALLQPPDHIAVGASTALFGALGLVSGHGWGAQSMPWRGGLRRWAPVAAGVMLLVLLGTGGERTDVGAHFAGFAVGWVMGFALALVTLGKRPGRRVQRVAGVAACLLFGLAWLLALLHANPG